MSAPNTVLIIGSGLGGVTAAGALRDSGFTGRIILLGEEAELPYDRPPLSKSVLVHDNLEQLVATNLPADLALRAPQEIALRPWNWYAERGIDLMLGRRAVRIDTRGHRVEIDRGDIVSYDRLLLAIGARARRLPSVESGAAYPLYLRSLRDAIELRSRLRPGSKVVLLGGGVIGMEVAASAVLRGCDVTVVELAPRIMARALCPSVAMHVEDYHRLKGVKLHLEAHAIGQATGAHPGLQLADGRIIPADLIVIGIGVVPNTELASDAGIHCDDGILVDAHGATSAPDVYAAGDAVRYPDEFFGRPIRSENWMHAQNQAVVVAKNLLGPSEPYRQVSHMWSDQYDLKIQVAGVCDTGQHALRGSIESNKFLLFHLSDGTVTGATSINEPRDMKFAQKLIEARTPVEAEKLRDPNFNLKKAAMR